MCLLYGLLIWIRFRGKIAVIFQPFPHVVVFTSKGVIHATNRTGRWKIERMRQSLVAKWLYLPQKSP